MFANEITLDRIEVPTGRRTIDPAVVNHLVKSIAAVGLQHPIAVRQHDGDGSYVLVAGAHRLAAFRELKMERIPANVVDLNTLEAELLEIDENLARNELSPAERTAAITRRKTVYEGLHPETKHGTIGGGRGKAGEKADRFTKVTAEATGRSERAVQRDAARGETLGQETLAKIARTTLDKGVELDALANLSVDDRAALVDRAVAGEAVSAQVAPNAAGVVDSDEDPDEVDFLAKADAAIAAARYSGDMLYETLIEKSREVVSAWQRCLMGLEREWEAQGE
jgi:ParB family transcriptional regulator, chromosome partitioning protein